eukprot:TRINITY_DN5676_c0_g1_i1.p1 TRINITY_DN5676_c0_g1~~TRINITY_DN5676_c0_g1_i1.p1  ORF type:complete len:750 (+),score=99.50 TRINITY_DN5676_c0_g1_i1:49-2298(+)
MNMNRRSLLTYVRERGTLLQVRFYSKTGSLFASKRIELPPPPEFWENRIDVFRTLYERQQREHESKEAPITVQLPDGKQLPGTAYRTTPLDIAQSISNSMADKMLAAKVNNELWDLGRPLEGDCTIDLLDWDSPEGRKIFWHSSAHILGTAMEWKYGAKLSTGPALEDGGFFYEAETESPVSETDYQSVEAIVKEVVTKKHPFQRLVVAKEEALELFKYNSFKSATIRDKVPDGGWCTVYRCGPLVDPCSGPHLPHTGRVKALTVHKNSSSYWRNKDTNPVLQRLYGMSFPKEKLLTEWKEVMAAAAKNDHRKLGVRQGLWMFHDHSPGSCFWFPNGAKIYNKLQNWLRQEYRLRGFEEVITPNMYNRKLWETSGHWTNYSDDMYRIDDDSNSALKPMNCPGHCLMYSSTRRSYRELPIRYADFGVLHRNELTGALSGLTRVRRFCQDDAHIFCLPEQVTTEIEGALEFLEHIYNVLGFKFFLALSTRPPKKMLGDHELWDKSEAHLARALNKFCGIPEGVADPQNPSETFTFDGSESHVRKMKIIQRTGDFKIKQLWTLNPGDGAFYGPKIDIRIEDCMKRKHQLGTLQLDFTLPERFDLVYEKPADDGLKTRPVMIHRAILGSLERCIAILAEHWKGKWPFWISPRQATVIPVSEQHLNYAKQVKDELFTSGYEVTVDTSDAKLGKKIRNAQIAQYNFILVVGEEEMAKKTVTVRSREDAPLVEKSVPQLLETFSELSIPGSRSSNC